MFDLAIGNSGWPPQLMEAFGLVPEIVGRYRDHWMERGEDEDSLVLALYTRNGGGNRPDYDDELEAMHALPMFVSDADDTFDSTYCTLRFRTTREQFYQWMQDLEDRNPLAERPSHDVVWQELWGAAEPNPRNMDHVWQAMLQTLEDQLNQGK